MSRVLRTTASTNAVVCLCAMMAFLLASVAQADYLEISRAAWIRALPASQSTGLLRVDEGDQLPLLSPGLTNRYYHVQLPGSTQGGYVYHTLGRRFSGTVPGAQADWGLHIVVFSVGQADAVALVSATGHACVIDAGRWSRDGQRVAAFLQNAETNGVGEISTVTLAFATHYDADHIGGFGGLAGEGISFENVYDQGPSRKRSGKAVYTSYLGVVGDPNDNMEQDTGETRFVRRRAAVGLSWTLGSATIRCVGVRGDTLGVSEDLDLDPSDRDIDENPGSVALLVTLGEFELYTSGDQTSAQWKSEPDTEMHIVQSGVLGGNSDIDVLKVSHHGSDTSTGTNFVRALDPEVTIISSEHTQHGIPKRITIKTLVDNGARVFITGDAEDPDDGHVPESNATDDDRGYSPPAGRVFNNVGDVHIFVNRQGTSYRVVADGVSQEFSAVDGDNPHP